MLVEVPAFGFNESLGLTKKSISINFSRANTEFCLSLHCNSDDSYLFVNEKEILKCKATIKMLILGLNFLIEMKTL